MAFIFLIVITKLLIEILKKKKYLQNYRYKTGDKIEYKYL